MKNLILIITIAFPLLSYGQKTKCYSLKSGKEFITIVLDEHTFPSNLFITKDIDNEQKGISANKNELYLEGEFISEADGTIILDYEKYNYYFVPFEKSKPFVWLNKNKKNRKGSLRLGTNNLLTPGPGDILYYCTCGGHTKDSTTPGGCLSSKKGNIIRCVADEDQCTKGCVGSAVTSSLKAQGGGLLIQTTKSIIHDFRINKGNH